MLGREEEIMGRNLVIQVVLNLEADKNPMRDNEIHRLIIEHLWRSTRQELSDPRQIRDIVEH